jgi:hypothetical protein
MDDEHDEVKPIYESFGYGECVTNIHESDML